MYLYKNIMKNGDKMFTEISICREKPLLNAKKKIVNIKFDT